MNRKRVMIVRMARGMAPIRHVPCSQSAFLIKVKSALFFLFNRTVKDAWRGSCNEVEARRIECFDLLASVLSLISQSNGVQSPFVTAYSSNRASFPRSKPPQIEFPASKSD